MPFDRILKTLWPPYKNRLIRADAFGDAVAVDILVRQDVEALRSLFGTIRDHWTDRYFYSVAMSRSFPMHLLRRWTESDPASADARLVYGASLLKWAWEARGYGLGSSVTNQRAERFYRRLEMARDELEQSAQLNKGDPTPWAYLIMVALYSQAGPEAQQYCFQQAINRHAENWTAHMHRLMTLSRKWGGSHEQMFEFAYESGANAPQGSLLPALVVKAHLEYRKYLLMFEGNPQGAEKHLRNPEAKREVLEACERSLGANSYDERAAIFARINSAGWFWLTQNRDVLRHELSALEGRLQDIHWRWVGAEGELTAARKFAGLAS